ncbi:sensor histidine kinase [Sphingomonas crocodyli]|uniref:histidine kinase n=1 Tax=Sphingomonas crocodyli TaxID=1979270 RepID=A0A437LY50_9SPHN|nr:GAF domain-containing protein [Sphingomonas crocodyli]RVT90348.1 GAF domain-containing protein [Sphingomonas crocodyli]
MSALEARLHDKTRLAALHDYMVLDTPPEPNFDDIVQLASQLCDTPISLISLVDSDRQWFKARVGLEAPETPIDQSVCKLGLSAEDLLIIPDLAADPRTADNSLVRGDPNIRFYAGAPLIAPQGDVLGMLCVIDHEPRPGGLSPEQQTVLATLARQVIAQLELRYTMLRRLEADAERRHLNEQLTERLNQTLAMINGLASQTLRAVPSRGPVESFQNRLDALTEAHELLQRKQWSKADMATVVRSSVERHAPPGRFTASGPIVRLGPKPAITVAMLIHELGSNAVKYGAFSNASGHVEIVWSVTPDASDPVLTLAWTERGGPIVSPPSQRSFGAKLIAMGLGAGGAVREDFGAAGYSASFEAPLSFLQRDEARADGYTMHTADIA